MKRYLIIGLFLAILFAGNTHAATFTVAIPIHDGGTLAIGLEQYDVLEGVGDGIRLEGGPYSKVTALWELNNAWTDSVGGYTLTPRATNPTFDGTNKKLGSHSADFGSGDGTTAALHATLLDTVPADGFWFSVWIRFDTTFDSGAGTSATILEKQNIDGEDRLGLFADAITGSLVVFYEENNNGYLSISSPQTSWTGGTQYHIVVKWDTTDGIELWVDGSRAVNAAGATTIMNDGTFRDFTVGNAFLAGNPFLGNIDSLVLGSGNLTSADIAWLYNSGNGRELTKYSDESPATTRTCTEVGAGTLDMSTTRLIVLKDDVVQAVTSTDVKCQYATSCGGALNGSWLTMENFRLESDITSGEIEVTCQANTDGSYQTAMKYKMEIDFTPTGGGGQKTFMGGF